MTLHGKQIPRNSFNFISRICEQKEPIISHSLIPYFRKHGCDKLMELGFFSQIENSKTFSNQDGDDFLVHFNNDNFGYYQNKVWHQIDCNSIKQYRLNIKLLILVIARDLEIFSESEEIVKNHFWKIGSLTTKIPIFFARRIHHSDIFNRIDQSLTNRSGINRGLILTTSKRIQNGFSFAENHKLISINDLLSFDNKNFHIDKNIINSSLGISNTKSGFSDSYRSAVIDGIKYTFTKKQSAIIEILDQEKRPIHKHELMVAAESEQDDPKYIFRFKGKYHPAWNKIIKFDNQGYYWLNY